MNSKTLPPVANQCDYRTLRRSEAPSGFLWERSNRGKIEV